MDQIICLRLKHALEEVEERYKDNIDHHIYTISTILKIHVDMIFATSELIKKPHVRHKK